MLRPASEGLSSNCSDSPGELWQRLRQVIGHKEECDRRRGGRTEGWVACNTSMHMYMGLHVYVHMSTVYVHAHACMCLCACVPALAPGTVVYLVSSRLQTILWLYSFFF